MSVTAYCPGHISGYFRRIISDSPAATGSIGAGIVIDPGVNVRVSEAQRTRITVLMKTGRDTYRQIADHAPPLAHALKKIGVDASVVTECRLPIGAGFGLSAAALLAMLTAINQLYDLGMDPHSIAAVAHETEVEHRTGLGDVAACQNGGRVVRTSPGIDGTIRRSFDITGPVWAVSFGPIPTPTVLRSADQMACIERAFPRAEPASAGEFFGHSRAFAHASGLVTGDVGRVLAACKAEQIPAGMTMLGNGVFAYGSRAREVLRVFGNAWRCDMAHHGPRIIGVDP